MPPAARVNDPTTHGNPLAPGPGSPDVKIGFMPAWRALPTSVAGAMDAISDSMDSFMKKSVLNPPSAASDIVKISQNLIQGGAKAAAAGAPSAIGAAAGQVATLVATNIALTATWTAASVVPGGQPAADQAFTQGIKAAAAAAASATVSAMASLADMHMCPLPCPIPPHGPGFVTKGSKSVIINSLPACRQNDKVMEACGGADPIAMGCPTVLIGDDGGGPATAGPAGGAAAAAAAAQSEQQAQVQSSAAALADAAQTGAPLIEITNACRVLPPDRPDKPPAFVRFQLVDEDTGEPLTGIPLEIKLPDGTVTTQSTDGSGVAEFEDLDPPAGTTDIVTVKDRKGFEVRRVESVPG